MRRASTWSGVLGVLLGGVTACAAELTSEEQERLEQSEIGVIEQAYEGSYFSPYESSIQPLHTPPGACGRYIPCRVKAWQNPNGGYAAGRLAWELNQGRWEYTCHYGWGGGDHWRGGSSVQILSNGHLWIDWNGSNHAGGPGTTMGDPHCAAWYTFGGCAGWWPGKIAHGVCYIPGDGREVARNPRHGHPVKTLPGPTIIPP